MFTLTVARQEEENEYNIFVGFAVVLATMR